MFLTNLLNAKKLPDLVLENYTNENTEMFDVRIYTCFSFSINSSARIVSIFGKN